ncbi:cell division topological specificity factor MinE [Blochmannia endosymbiont of Polyrhachis (Hedomyrma) turneri]|uniref:cell division topological specificity factor MinE n=1 Tax=Blochmannia endosymbiont of Polyrhachis (Hedomyrma) turneri TaxID=1505596 RepID=UPI00061A7E39|nr:cell division topological specificity factor MinE [Blochmannia endosymbiont of Polyrhachis (Hedomyrma) turneri]AKC60005.1 cell division topological specificity factor [Blochmannia endosymbiont of Polyrhachis (Hedomyrma) turneri]
MYLISLLMIRKKTPANIAKQRLKTIVTKQRLLNNQIPNYLPQLKRDILNVVCKYTQINSKTISMQFEKKNDNTSRLELNIILNEQKK